MNANNQTANTDGLNSNNNKKPRIDTENTLEVIEENIPFNNDLCTLLRFGPYDSNSEYIELNSDKFKTNKFQFEEMALGQKEMKTYYKVSSQEEIELLQNVFGVNTLGNEPYFVNYMKDYPTKLCKFNGIEIIVDTINNRIVSLQEQITAEGDNIKKKRLIHQLEWFNQTALFLKNAMTTSKNCEIKPSCTKNKSSSSSVFQSIFGKPSAKSSSTSDTSDDGCCFFDISLLYKIVVLINHLQNTAPNELKDQLKTIPIEELLTIAKNSNSKEDMTGRLKSVLGYLLQYLMALKNSNGENNSSLNNDVLLRLYKLINGHDTTKTSITVFEFEQFIDKINIKLNMLITNESELNRLNSEINFLKQQLKNCSKVEGKTTNKDYTILFNKYLAIQDALKKMTGERDNLRQIIDDALLLVTDAKNERDTIFKYLMELNNKIQSERAENLEIIKNLQAELAKLKAEFDALQIKYNALINSGGKPSNEVAKLREEIDKLNKEKIELIDLIDKAKEEENLLRKSLIDMYNDLINLINELKNELAITKAELISLKKDCDDELLKGDGNKKTEALQSRINILEKLISEITSGIQEAKNLVDIIKNNIESLRKKLEETINNLQKELNETKNELEKCKAKNLENTQKMEGLQTIIDSMYEQIQAAQNEITKLRGRNKINSQKEINDLKIELQKTKEALEILQKQKQQDDITIKNLQDKINSIIIDIETAQNELETIMEIIDSLRSFQADKDQRTSEFTTQLIDKITRLKGEIGALERQGGINLKNNDNINKLKADLLNDLSLAYIELNEAKKILESLRLFQAEKDQRTSEFIRLLIDKISKLRSEIDALKNKSGFSLEQQQDIEELKDNFLKEFNKNINKDKLIQIYTDIIIDIRIDNNKLKNDLLKLINGFKEKDSDYNNLIKLFEEELQKDPELFTLIIDRLIPIVLEGDTIIIEDLTAKSNLKALAKKLKELKAEKDAIIAKLTSDNEICNKELAALKAEKAETIIELEKALEILKMINDEIAKLRKKPDMKNSGTGTETETGTNAFSTTETGTGTDAPSTTETGTGTNAPSTTETGTGTNAPSTTETGTGTDLTGLSIDELEKKAKDQEKIITSLKLKQVELETKIRNLERNNVFQQATIEAQKERIAQLEKDIASLIEKNRQEIERLSGVLNGVSKDRDECRSALAIVKAEINNLKASLKISEDNLAICNALIAAKDKEIEELRKNIGRNGICEQQIAALQAEKTKLEEDLVRLKALHADQIKIKDSALNICEQGRKSAETDRDTALAKIKELNAKIIANANAAAALLQAKQNEFEEALKRANENRKGADETSNAAIKAAQAAKEVAEAARAAAESGEAGAKARADAAEAAAKAAEAARDAALAAASTAAGDAARSAQEAAAAKRDAEAAMADAVAIKAKADKDIAAAKDAMNAAKAEREAANIALAEATRLRNEADKLMADAQEALASSKAGRGANAAAVIAANNKAEEANRRAEVAEQAAAAALADASAQVAAAKADANAARLAANDAAAEASKAKAAAETAAKAKAAADAAAEAAKGKAGESEADKAAAEAARDAALAAAQASSRDAAAARAEAEAARAEAAAAHAAAEAAEARASAASSGRNKNSAAAVAARDEADKARTEAAAARAEAERARAEAAAAKGTSSEDKKAAAAAKAEAEAARAEAAAARAAAEAARAEAATSKAEAAGSDSAKKKAEADAAAARAQADNARTEADAARAEAAAAKGTSSEDKKAAAAAKAEAEAARAEAAAARAAAEAAEARASAASSGRNKNSAAAVAARDEANAARTEANAARAEAERARAEAAAAKGTSSEDKKAKEEALAAAAAAKAEAEAARAEAAAARAEAATSKGEAAGSNAAKKKAEADAVAARAAAQAADIKAAKAESDAAAAIAAAREAAQKEIAAAQAAAREAIDNAENQLANAIAGAKGSASAEVEAARAAMKAAQEAARASEAALTRLRIELQAETERANTATKRANTAEANIGRLEEQIKTLTANLEECQRLLVVEKANNTKAHALLDKLLALVALDNEASGFTEQSEESHFKKLREWREWTENPPSGQIPRVIPDRKKDPQGYKRILSRIIKSTIGDKLNAVGIPNDIFTIYGDLYKPTLINSDALCDEIRELLYKAVGGPESITKGVNTNGTIKKGDIDLPTDEMVQLLKLRNQIKTIPNNIIFNLKGVVPNELLNKSISFSGKKPSIVVEDDFKNPNNIPIGILAIKFLQTCGGLANPVKQDISSDQKSAVDYIVDEMVGKAPPAGLSKAQLDYYLTKKGEAIKEPYEAGNGLSLEEVKKYAGVPP